MTVKLIDPSTNLPVYISIADEDMSPHRDVSIFTRGNINFNAIVWRWRGEIYDQEEDLIEDVVNLLEHPTRSGGWYTPTKIETRRVIREEAEEIPCVLIELTD